MRPVTIVCKLYITSSSNFTAELSTGFVGLQAIPYSLAHRMQLADHKDYCLVLPESSLPNLLTS
jgi:hypothetical protein